MPRRPRRDFDALTEAQLLAGRTTARRIELDRVPRRSAAGRDSQSVADLLDTIAAVAEAATGDRSFLHLKASPLGDGPIPEAQPLEIVADAQARLMPVEIRQVQAAPLPGGASGDLDAPSDGEPELR
jgi:hypothetical protein